MTTSVKEKSDELNIAVAEHARDVTDTIAQIEDEASVRITESREHWDAFLAEIKVFADKQISDQTVRSAELVKHLKALVARYQGDKDAAND